MDDDPQRDPGSVDEADLIAAARDGDHRAFAQLVTLYRNRLFRFVLERIGNREDAEDVLQLTFVSAYRNLSGYRPEYRFSTWLFTLAHRRTVDHLRKRHRIPAEAVGETESEPHPADSLETRESRGHLWVLARRLLSSRQHNALWLRYGEDLDVAEIATITGLSRTHVKVLLYRARKALGRHLLSRNEEYQSQHQPSSEDSDETVWLRHPMSG